jgi:transcriptional regulator with XRE-family HTH domain
MIGDDLKAYRHERRWRQRDLADFLGIDQPAVSEMERGVRPISDEVALKLGGSPSPASADQDEGAPAPPEEPAASPGDRPVAASGDVPPRPVTPPRDKPAVLPRAEDLRALEVRLLQLIRGYDATIMVADPGDTQIREVTQHIPGLADVVGMANKFDGQIIEANAVALSKAWVAVARENRRVRVVLEALTAGGAWRDAFAATLPVVLAILLNHGLLPTLPGLMVSPQEPYDGAGEHGDGGAASGAWGAETAAGAVG